MFFRRAPAAIFACTFMKILFTSAATPDRTLVALIYTVEDESISRLHRLSFLKIFFVSIWLKELFVSQRKSGAISNFSLLF